MKAYINITNNDQFHFVMNIFKNKGWVLEDGKEPTGVAIPGWEYEGRGFYVGYHNYADIAGSSSIVIPSPDYITIPFQKFLEIEALMNNQTTQTDDDGNVIREGDIVHIDGKNESQYKRVFLYKDKNLNYLCVDGLELSKYEHGEDYSAHTCDSVVKKQIPIFNKDGQEVEVDKQQARDLGFNVD